MDGDRFRQGFAILLKNLDKSSVTSPFAEYLRREWEHKLDNFGLNNRLSNTIGDSAGVSYSLWSTFNSFKAQVGEELAQKNNIHPVGDEPLASNSVVVKQKRLFATQKKHGR